MNRKTRIIVVTCLLAAAGAWLFWRHGGPKTAGHEGVASRQPGQSAPKPAATPATNAMAVSPSKFPTLNTNKLAYRLSNTTNSLRGLRPNPHAILLENALIDTEKPLDLQIPAQLRSSGNPGAYIVQARGVTDARFRAVLQAAGAQIVGFIPNNAYLVNLSASGAGELAGNQLVQAVLPYEPYYKIQSSLLGLAVNQQSLPPGMALNLAIFPADQAAVQQELESLGAKIIGQDRSPFGPVLRVLAPADWTSLVQLPAVQFAEPAHVRVAANDLSRVTLGISPDTTSPITNGYAVNGYVLTGNNVLVVVNDTGVDINHPDFSVGGSAESPGTVPPSRVSGLTPLDLVDTNGHGTFVAGVIAGNGSMSYAPVNVGSFAEGSVSNADFRGKAPLADIFSVNDSSYSDYQLQTNAALTGALISNNSWDYGNGDAEYDLAAASYDAATRDALPFTTGSQPVLFVFAAGNNGGGDDSGAEGSGDTILSPGTAKNVVTVGALEQLRYITNLVTTIMPGTGTNAPTTNQIAYWEPQTDSSNQVASYSSRGNVGIGTEGTFGRFKPDVVSPGTFVVSTSSQFNDEWDTNAYYNPTNDSQTAYTYQLVASNGLAYFNVLVPPNAVGVGITVSANNQSPNPFPSLVIYCQQSSPPDPINAPGSIDITSYGNSVSIPPGGGNCTLPSLLGNGFDFAVGNTNSFTVNYNVTVDVYTTNAVGDLYSVLEGMNDSLGGYYRYESGTSMAAASVSGVLALIQDYVTNTLALMPSPALMKALLINGARSTGSYEIALTNGINFQGWGLDNIQNSVPLGGLTYQFNTPGSSFFVDQNPTNALATGDSHTFIVTIDPTTYANYLQLQATLVWTDPPGDPAAAIKLVNSLDLVITNLDANDPNYGAVYYGNDISPDIGYNLPWNTNGPPNIDTINNVQNVLLPPLLGAKYSVTVVGLSVNVNAVTAQTNNAAGQYAPNIVQDYALVVSVGEGEVTNAFSVTDEGIASNPTDDQNFTVVTTTNAPLMNQMVGASSPLLGTNTLPLGNNTMWGPNGMVTIGQTNQWHFYMVTNTGPAADYTNAAFITFGVSTLSIPRMGVVTGPAPLNPIGLANATKPEADIDMFVSQDATLTNLNPVVISNCLAGVNNSGASLANAGTQFVYFTNSAPGQIYYVGIQSEDQMAAEYDFLPVFTDIPFSSLDANGNEIVNGLLLPMPTLGGNNAHPGVTNIFALAITPMVVEKVTVTNLVEHQNFGDLFGELSFSQHHVVLNNHDGFGDTIGNAPIVYDDSRDHVRGTTNSDGPGSLVNFRGLSALGPWILSELDDSAGGLTGQVSRLTLVIQPHRNLKQPGIIVAVPPGGWFVDYVDVPPGFTNLTFYGTNVTAAQAGSLPPGTPPLQMYEELGNDPTLTSYDLEATLTNGVPPGNSISIGPPLAPGRYFVGIYNPDVTISQYVFLSATLGINQTADDVFNYTSGSATVLPDDAVTDGSVIVVPNTVTQQVASVNVGLVINSPRISDYTFTLVSPTGQRVLLMENRGGGSTNGAGEEFVYTNVLNTTANGGGAANTNYLAVDPASASVPITWNFYTVPDQMTIYDTTNPALFSLTGGYLLYNTGLTNNPPGPGGGAQNTIPVTVNVAYPLGTSNITIIMNQFGNPDAVNGDAWTYTAGVAITNYQYLMFTDNTNLATVPIKFAEPPYNFTDLTTNYVFSDLDLATNGDYRGPASIYDPYGGWSVPTNLATVSIIETNAQFVLVTNVVALSNNFVSVVTDPTTALNGDAGNTNYLALGYGTITRLIPTIPGSTYNVTFWYRGPGIAGWWRGEGNALDSSDPENDNNNGALVGRFNFPAGEVGQAFEFEDPGNTYEFAATNTYVQVPASATLNVGAGGGFTVEGWINPTNLSRPEPLVEWLARVPTNTAITNISIVQGPVLDPATGNFYYLLGATNWPTSELWAEQLGGHLVTVATANLENWVYDTFTAYGTLNRCLWIGLTNNGASGFGWSSGETGVTYANWLATQPNNCSGNANFTLILGPTNAEPGLWALANANGFICNSTATNPVYGVVEVSNIPTNGVQFWISGTNWTPGTTNSLQGCLYANIVDTNFGSHQIFSAPGLLTTNVYQHVALTYNTNSGIAALYLNGTNVATTNLGVFMPKTDGDLLLGWDMSRYTNNFYAGEMDEMSVYARAMSDAEIFGIYSVSADTTNRLLGKFDPTITPAVGLAEALVSFGPNTNMIYGLNEQWSVDSFTFTATTNSMPLTISGLEPGILLDDFALEEAPATNLYYFPEQALASLVGDTAAGAWTLQVWDNRAGAFVPNVDQLVNWELSFVLNSNAIVSATLAPETPMTTTPPAGQTVYYAVPVPVWAHNATNILVSSDQPVNLVYFSPANPPTGANAPDATLLANQTSGVGAPILTTTSAAPFNLQPGSTYYLGVQNLSGQLATVTLEVDFDILGLTNGVPYTDVLTNEYSSVRYFSYDVATNAYEATFQLLQLSGNADLVVRKGVPLPDLTGADYGSFNSGTADQDIYVLTNSTVPLSPGLWFIGVINRDGTPIQYSVLAKELDTNTFPVPLMPAVITLTNDVPFTWTAGPGAALTNFFSFYATNSVVNGANVNLQGLRFELYNMTGNGDLTLQTNALPLAPPFFQTSQNSGQTPELIYVFTNSMVTNLAGYWYLGVPNREITNITYTIVVGIMTNSYFPAFPGAEGAGGGAVGAGHAGVISSVYHVTTTADSGFGSLRAALCATNRTVVFDIAGTIYLNSPLVVTNSNITIAGQTSPGGITVAGEMTVQGHDVVVRDVRFRTVSGMQLTNNFESVAAGDYPSNNFVGSWKVLANQSSVVNDPVDAYPGHNHFLALASGMISNNISTLPGRTYTVSLAYRGPGIISWWPGQGSGADVISGFNATVPAGVTYPFGEVGLCFGFNGSEFLTVPNEPALNPANAITVECWSYTLGKSVPQTWSEELVSKDSECIGVRQYLLQFGDNQIHSGSPDARGCIWLSSGQYVIDGPTVPLVGPWYHFAMTYDGTVFKLYLNGALEGQMAASGSIDLYSSPVRIGGGAPSGCPDYNVNGTVDEPSIYNRALSASEIKAIYTKGSAGKFDPTVFSSSPAQSLAEASFSIAGATNVLLGNNTNWQTQTITFVATGTSTPLVISGVEPGMLVDSLSVTVPSDLGGSFQFNTASNVIADHISASWSTNEEMSVVNSTNVTVQWSIMADSLYSTNSSPTNGPTGSLLRQGGGMLSFYHNLYADNYTGSPRLGDSLTLDFENNVIYNWGFRSGLSGGTNDLLDFSPNGCTNQLNYVCNYLIAGPDTVNFAANNYNITNIAFFGGGTNAITATWIFQTNNFIDSDHNGILNGTDTGLGMFTNCYTPFSRPFATPLAPVDEAYQAYEKVLNFAGAYMAQRDSVDTNIVTNVRYQTGRIINTPGALPVITSALPYLDTDQDGLPDFFEYTFTPGLVYIPSNNNDRTGDGYTDLEEYDNWLAGPHAVTFITNSVAVDLYQLCGESGHLAFFLTNNVQGLAYLTNRIGSVTNTGTWSNSIAVFTPTNNASGTNYTGYASFGFYVTNLDTAAYFGPVPVSVIVSAVPIQINSNIPPVITPLASGVPLDPTNYGGTLFYSIVVTTNDFGALFELDNPTGPMALVVSTNPYPSLSSYDYYTNLPASPANLEVAVLTNSMPVPLTPGTWYMGAVNEAGPNSNVVFTAKITLLTGLVPPVFFFPTNTTVTNILETVPWAVSLVATDLDMPPLPLSFALANAPTNMSISNSIIYWTPTEAQGPSTNSVAVSVSNGAFTVTNTFTIVVEESNLPPILPTIPNQFVIVPGTLVVTNTATDPDIPTNALGYVLTSTVTGPNTPVIDTNGIITWTPTLGQAQTNYLFTTVVTDTNPWAVNAQSLSDTNTFGVFVVPTLTPGVPITNIYVGASNILWFAIPVPTNAIFATNTLIYSTLPINIWYSTNVPPTITNAADRALLWNATNGVSVLSTNLATAPTNIVPGGTYFLGVQNTNNQPVSGAIEIDFAFATPPPVLDLPVIPDQYIAAGDTLVVTNTATDTYVTAPPGYSLAASPAGALISSSGIITWVTSTSTAPGTVVFTTIATDTGANVSATNSFNVVVLPGLGNGEPPQTNTVPPNGINWFLVHVPKNADMATNFLLFATAPVDFWFSTNVPPSITNATDVEFLTNSTGGSRVITTTSTPPLVPGSRYFLGVQNPNSFAVNNAVDVKFHLLPPPTFSIFSITPTNFVGTNGYLVAWFAPTNDQFHLQWAPALAPSNWTNFNGVISDAVTGSPTNGMFQYFDDGSQTGGFGPMRFYRLLLLNSPTNTAPFFLNTPTLLYASPSNTFAFTNTAKDWDIPAQTLVYFVTNTLAGTNVIINTNTGVINWTPNILQLGLTNTITTTVTDNGVPPKSAVNMFEVVVTTNLLFRPSFGSVTIVANGVQFLWTAPTNDQFQIQWTTNLAPANWHLFPNTNTSTTGNFSFVDTNMPLLWMKFYELILLP